MGKKQEAGLNIVNMGKRTVGNEKSSSLTATQLTHTILATK